MKQAIRLWRVGLFRCRVTEGMRGELERLRDAWRVDGADGPRRPARLHKRADAADVIMVAMCRNNQGHLHILKTLGDGLARSAWVNNHALPIAHVGVAVGLYGANHKLTNLICHA